MPFIYLFVAIRCIINKNIINFFNNTVTVIIKRAVLQNFVYGATLELTGLGEM